VIPRRDLAVQILAEDGIRRDLDDLRKQSLLGQHNCSPFVIKAADTLVMYRQGPAVAEESGRHVVDWPEHNVPQLPVAVRRFLV
jgi:hypothetical protein